MSELCEGLSIYPQVLRNARVTDKRAAQDDADVQAAVKAVADSLGDSGRILVRESGTEPLVRVMVDEAMIIMSNIHNRFIHSLSHKNRYSR